MLEVRGTQADYTAVDAALAKVPEELSVYTETSVKVLQDAIDHVSAACFSTGRRMWMPWQKPLRTQLPH